MEAKISLILKRISRLSYVLGSICLLAGLILSYVNIPASAAELSLQEDNQETACTPPKDWDQTTRFNRNNPSKEWTFNVEDPEMDVELEFFWYQDYDPEGCPFDCVNTDECQDYETGDIESPLGNFSITDGKEGADGGTSIQSGKLTQGEYTVKFTFTGGRNGPLMGSINVGFEAKTFSVEPPTSTPTDLPPSTETPTATEITTETPTPTGILTDTPTPTGTTAATTSTVTPGSPEPSDTPTPTVTGTLPTETPTSTSTAVVLPPESSPTPTDVESKPPATLSPPTPPPGATRTPAIIPVTGLDLAYGGRQSFPSQNQFLNLGIGFLGIGLVFHGISRRLKKR